MHTECIVVLYDYMMKWGSQFKVQGGHRKNELAVLTRFQPILVQCRISIPLENVRKPLVF